MTIDADGVEPMRVLHIETDKVLSPVIRRIVEKNGFSYMKVHLENITDKAIDYILQRDEYSAVILDQCVLGLVEKLINIMNTRGMIHPSIITISSQQDFNLKKRYFELGVMAHFDRENFAEHRLEQYLQTIKNELETVEFFKEFHVAVIDDSELSLDTIRKFFINAGTHNVDYYQESAEFLNSKRRYDLFLIDLVMPVYDGEALTSYIRKTDSEAIIILMTAYNNGQIIPHCLSLGANDFMTKPLEYNSFMLRIQSCISRYKMQKEIIYKNNELFEMAIRDNLTGIYNRTYFSQIYEEKLAAAKTGNQVFWLIMVDIDNFKNINDEYGHLEGDKVLRNFAVALSDSLPDKDTLYRWGGEEFIALLQPYDDKKTVYQIAEKMRVNVKKNNFHHKWNITGSFGMAKWNPADTGEKLFRRLDNSLYLAKLTGKDKIVCEEYLNIMENGRFIRITWGSFFTSGNAIIDEDHQAMINAANNIIDSYEYRAEQMIINKELNNAYKHIMLHFNKEEDIIKNLNYEHYEEHTKEHRKLMAELLRLYDSYSREKSNAIDVIKFLVQDVIVGHIVQKDFDFYPLFGHEILKQ